MHAEGAVTGVDALCAEIDEISDPVLRTRVVATWEAALAESAFPDDLAGLPFHLEAPQETLLAHVRRVVQVALLLAGVVEGSGRQVDRDVLVAACLLHDVDKVLMVEPDGSGGLRPSPQARRFGHGVLGAMLCREHGLPEQVVHLVLTHTATSLLAPEPLEGVVLHYADFFAADAALHEARADLLMSR